MTTENIYQRTKGSMDATAQSYQTSHDGNETDPIESLRREAELQKLLARIGQAESRVAQQQAIARRIEMAAEVEIEELYAFGDDNGLANQDRPVSRRIYRFKGRLPERVKPINEINRD